MKFPSKKGLVSSILLGGSLLFMFGVAVYAILDQAWVPLLIIVLSIWLVYGALFGTYYVFREQDLFVKAGPFRWKIPYDQIQSVQKTRSILSGPALSLDRLEIKYRMGAVLISPVRQEEFVAELAKRSPLIRIL